MRHFYDGKMFFYLDKPGGADRQRKKINVTLLRKKIKKNKKKYIGTDHE